MGEKIKEENSPQEEKSLKEELVKKPRK